MRGLERLRPTPSTVIASIALLVALGGTSIAAVEATVPDNSVGAAQLKTNAVTNPKIASNAVTAAKIAANAVTAAKIAANAVTNAKIASSAVTNSKIASSAVTNAKLAANAVTSSNVQNGTLIAADFAPGQIPAGPAGPAGAAGPAGPAGPAGAAGPGATWVLVGKDGNVVASSTGLSVQINHPSQGAYYLTFTSPITSRALLVTPAYRDADTDAGRLFYVASCGGAPVGAQCPNSGFGSSTAYIGMFDKALVTAEDHAFYFAML